MKHTAALAVLLTLTVTIAPFATQDRTAEEKAIRDIVTKINAGSPPPDQKPLPDAIFWSGAMVKPQVGTEKPQFRPGSSAGSRRDAKTNVQIVQLHVASSGDMAYEYSTFKSWWVREDTKKAVEVEGALLRTWRKVNGQWQVGAQFLRPYENTLTDR